MTHLEVKLLPILKKAPQVGLIVEQRKPDATKDESSEEDQALSACAQDIISAVHSKDTKALIEALKSFLECSDMPSDEDDNSFDAQNVKAAQD